MRAARVPRTRLSAVVLVATVRALKMNGGVAKVDLGATLAVPSADDAVLRQRAVRLQVRPHGGVDLADVDELFVLHQCAFHITCHVAAALMLLSLGGMSSG